MVLKPEIHLFSSCHGCSPHTPSPCSCRYSTCNNILHCSASPLAWVFHHDIASDFISSWHMELFRRICTQPSAAANWTLVRHHTHRCHMAGLPTNSLKYYMVPSCYTPCRPFSEFDDWCCQAFNRIRYLMLFHKYCRCRASTGSTSIFNSTYTKRLIMGFLWPVLFICLARFMGCGGVQHSTAWQRKRQSLFTSVLWFFSSLEKAQMTKNGELERMTGGAEVTDIGASVSRSSSIFTFRGCASFSILSECGSHSK